MALAPPTLHVIAGPNGAGKTTFYEQMLRRLTTAEFVNADRLAMEAFGHVAVTQAESAEGQRLAEERRRSLMRARQSLVAETTFSHPSKLALVEEAKALGYQVTVYHLNVRDADVAVQRVSGRVSQGGHPAPEDRIRARYQRNQPLIREAVLKAHRAFVFDNSLLSESPKRLISFVGGKATSVSAELPDWAISLYGDDLP
ncbi:MAG: AAA family ATPase [Pseudomonadota bacterium]